MEKTSEIVPEFETKLGASYDYSLAQGDISLNMGWMWVNYFDALTRSYVGGASQTTSLSLQGPFVGLTWLGSLA
jgi:hypothetical protein